MPNCQFNLITQETQLAKRRVAEAEQKNREIQAQSKDINLRLAAADVRLNSANVNELFSSGQGFQALLASLRTGQQLKQLNQKTQEEDNTRSKTMAALWQTVYGVREHNSFKGHEDSVRSVSFSPDGKTIASGGDDTIKLWSWDFKSLMSLGCDWIHDYLMTNPDAREDDRKMCGISGKKIEQTKTGD